MTYNDMLALCRKVAAVWGWSIGERVTLSGKTWLACDWSDDAIFELDRVTYFLAARVEAETDPEKIAKLCRLFTAYEGRRLVRKFADNCEEQNKHHVPNDSCKVNATYLSRMLREAKDDPLEVSKSAWDDDSIEIARVRLIVDRAIAEHEATYHKCPHCGKEKG